MKALVCKEGGNFHEYWHPKAPKKHETSLWVHRGPGSILEGRYFGAGLAPPRATLLPDRKGPNPWDSASAQRFTRGGSAALAKLSSRHPVILAVGLGNKKAMKWGVVRTE